MRPRAATLADFLAGRPEVLRVWYPTRKDHPQHDLAAAQMTAGGTVVTFELAGKAEAFTLLNALRLIAISNNLGDSKSLITHPATTTHMRIGAEERARLGITDGVLRLSVGLEDALDLQARPRSRARRGGRRRTTPGRRVMTDGYTATTRGDPGHRAALLPRGSVRTGGGAVRLGLSRPDREHRAPAPCN